jgi:hypothetical protein
MYYETYCVNVFRLLDAVDRHMLFCWWFRHWHFGLRRYPKFVGCKERMGFVKEEIVDGFCVPGASAKIFYLCMAQKMAID